MLQSRFKYYLGREVLTDNERQDSLDLGKKVLGGYFQRYRGELAKATLLEYSFAGHGVHLGDLRLTGRIDKIELLGSGQVKVVDYKTGNPDSADRYIKPGGEYHRQLVFYQLLCDRSSVFNYTMVSGELDFVQISAKRKKYIKPQYVISDAAVRELADTIDRVWAEIKELRFLRPESGCGQCEYCKREAVPARR